MQGEGISSNPFRDNYYYFNNGSGPRSLNLIQLMEAPNPQQDSLSQPDLNEEPCHSFSYVDLLTRERSPSPFEGSTSLRWNQCSYGSLTFQGATSSGAPSGSIGLNLPFTYSPSNPVVLTSGTTQYEVEENVSMQNPSIDGRHFLLKRRVPEDDSGYMSLDGSSSSALQAQNCEQLGVAAQANVCSSLNRYAPLHLNSDLIEQIENDGRNVRFSRTNDLQDYIPALPSNSVNMQQHSQPGLHFPHDPFVNYASASSVPFIETPTAQRIAQGYNFLQNLCPTQLNGANMFCGFYQEMNSMERASYMNNPSDSPVVERGYLENMQGNVNMAFPGAGSMADTGIIAAAHQAPFSSTFPQTNWANSHMMENLIANVSESHGHYHPMHSFHAATNQTGRVSNIRRGHASSSQARQRVARRGVRRPPRRIRLPSATERRRRFINEELNALGEQLGIIANEVEQIQVVEYGLTEDTIMAHLTRETHHPAAAGAEEHRVCSICQDEYAEGDLLGKLDCMHDYHFDCIKQWLLRKNSCPMCRHRALAI
ncbi:hypothetical protein SLEP1_g8204 [Rubroshorea leprosula]|uniref:RING-type E3 ubiquitin transferase n=1 Tax=Rubroshorea leprosula TaxID=152421 RepID=A0AAV5I0Z0_9ROSI|nr:hypothetical protein SLEP1_g8204 [Rubroshorea leprosula]